MRRFHVKLNLEKNKNCEKNLFSTDKKASKNRGLSLFLIQGPTFVKLLLSLGIFIVTFGTYFSNIRLFHLYMFGDASLGHIFLHNHISHAIISAYFANMKLFTSMCPLGQFSMKIFCSRFFKHEAFYLYVFVDAFLRHLSWKILHCTFCWRKDFLRYEHLNVNLNQTFGKILNYTPYTKKASLYHFSPFSL